MNLSDTRSRVPVRVSLLSNIEHPAVFDLSGTTPFELYLCIRSAHGDPRPLTIQTAGSVFDSEAALAKGLYKLINVTTGEEVELPTSSPSPRPNLEPFITLPPDSKDHPVAHKLPLNASSWLRDLTIAKNTYSLELRHPDDLAIQWWHWGAEPDILPPNARHESPSELPPASSGEIKHNRSRCYLHFSVVSHMELPPTVNVELAGLPGGKSVLVTTCNTTSQTFTLRVRGHQQYTRRLESNPELSDPPHDPSATVIASKPHLKNLSVINLGTDEELVRDHPSFVCGPGGGHPRVVFLTLRPGEKVSREMELPVQRMEVGQDYRVRLRTKGCWWTSGTVDDLFADVKEGESLRRLPGQRTLPVWLKCDEEVIVTYAG